MITGIDKVVYGVEDLDKCVKFFDDWGLALVERDAAGARFETRDGAEVVLRPTNDPALPPAFEHGSTLRRVVWGVEDGRALDDVVGRLSENFKVAEGEDGPACSDIDGLSLSFRVSRRRAFDNGEPGMNMAGSVLRIDQRAPVYERANPLNIGHVVLFTPDVMAAVRFYQDSLGFVLSDYYPEAGFFLRCTADGGHHNLFLLQTPDRKRGLNHVAFTVRDVHEVFGGGMHVNRCGWKTQIGPGRHPVSSAYFWYVHNPAGGLAEYYADEDYCTAAWRAEAWERTPENFAEWAIVGGLDGTTRRQVSGPGD
ncbi:MAG: glyoxalase [Alphaproteobacteria bacterium]|nr:glyoxalase [Alphaproteobacteria bacterium]